jgi:hypothetical protein
VYEDNPVVVLKVVLLMQASPATVILAEGTVLMDVLIMFETIPLTLAPPTVPTVAL